MRTKETLIALSLIMAGSPAVLAQGAHLRPGQSVEAMTTELQLIRDQLRARPTDPQLLYKAAELLRGLGKPTEAVRLYSAATKAAPDMYIAYHQVSILCTDNEALDECIQRLTARSREKPDELMLRVALSELLEKRGNHQQAARVLIDITYANKVPEKYKARVSARIHHLLAVSKNQQQAEVVENAATEEQLDVVPSPLPSQPTKRSLASAKIKDSKEVKGVGKVPLLP